MTSAERETRETGEGGAVPVAENLMHLSQQAKVAIAAATAAAEAVTAAHASEATGRGTPDAARRTGPDTGERAGPESGRTTPDWGRRPGPDSTRTTPDTGGRAAPDTGGRAAPDTGGREAPADAPPGERTGPDFASAFGFENGGSLEGGAPVSQPWPGFERFGAVQTILDQNRLLISEIKHNHETRNHDGLVRNVALIRQLNDNVAKVVELYGEISETFVHNFGAPTE